ncbi:MAG: tRNA (adenosine(37)-N6)-threonylcarbamoyltransferase complex dimerization subunit type 1 TsaB, partial [Pseudomonadota bacterium]
MKILALETSTEFCSVALYLDGKIFNKEILAERRHSEILLPMVHELLEESALALQQLDGIAFGAGPGSFTGLRIACGVAQGLAYATNLPVIGISTLEAVAQQIDEQKIIVALDARMGEIYHAAYQRLTNYDWQVISPPTLCLP